MNDKIKELLDELDDYCDFYLEHEAKVLVKMWIEEKKNEYE